MPSEQSGSIRVIRVIRDQSFCDRRRDDQSSCDRRAAAPPDGSSALSFALAKSDSHVTGSINASDKRR